MSCWVVPSVAAELWGCPMQAVRDAIRGGQLPTREENGWMFVDVAPDSPNVIGAPQPIRAATFDAISGAELAALTGPIEDYQIALEVAEDDQDPTTDEPEMIGDWRAIRQVTELRRRAPVDAQAPYPTPIHSS